MTTMLDIDEADRIAALALRLEATRLETLGRDTAAHSYDARARYLSHAETLTAASGLIDVGATLRAGELEDAAAALERFVAGEAEADRISANRYALYRYAAIRLDELLEEHLKTIGGTR